jgi:hypothetical protein
MQLSWETTTHQQRAMVNITITSLLQFGKKVEIYAGALPFVYMSSLAALNYASVGN